jgi:hypothetical protein
MRARAAAAVPLGTGALAGLAQQETPGDKAAEAV